MKKLLSFCLACLLSLSLANANVLTDAGFTEVQITVEFYDYLIDNETDIVDFAELTFGVGSSRATNTQELITFFKNGTPGTDFDLGIEPGVTNPDEDFGILFFGENGTDPFEITVNLQESFSTLDLYADVNDGLDIGLYQKDDQGNVNIVNYTVTGQVGGGGGNIPIDGGLSFLALGGIAFGISRVRKNKK